MDLCTQAVEVSSGIRAPLPVHVCLLGSFSGSYENTTLRKVIGYDKIEMDATVTQG